MSEDQRSNTAQFLIFTAESGVPRIEVRIEDETIWLTQKLMAELFDTSTQNITMHLKKVYLNEELQENSTCKKFLQVQREGDRDVERELVYYNLDAVIAVGYRVNTKQATSFRIWATKVLREFIIKGFAMDDERLKQGSDVFGKDYFKELLERVRSIRASERRIWLQITDIFAECSVDYLRSSQEARDFYAMVQNKFHFAIVGQTAAEIVHSKADRAKPNMGLITWKKSPTGRVLSSDVTVAKNYLEENEIKKLERTVSGFFDYIENIIEQRQTFSMGEFADSVDKFLAFNEYKVLSGKGEISASKAKDRALGEYAEFNKHQKIDSDFEKEVRKMLSNSQE